MSKSSSESQAHRYHALNGDRRPLCSFRRPVLAIQTRNAQGLGLFGAHALTVLRTLSHGPPVVLAAGEIAPPRSLTRGAPVSITSRPVLAASGSFAHFRSEVVEELPLCIGHLALAPLDRLGQLPEPRRLSTSLSTSGPAPEPTLRYAFSAVGTFGVFLSTIVLPPLFVRRPAVDLRSFASILVLKEVIVEFRPEIMFPLDPDEPVALRDHGHVHRTPNRLSAERHLLLKRAQAH